MSATTTTSRQSWINFADALNAASVDPTLRHVEFPLELHDDTHGIRWTHEGTLSGRFSWAVYTV